MSVQEMITLLKTVVATQNRLERKIEDNHQRIETRLHELWQQVNGLEDYDGAGDDNVHDTMMDLLPPDQDDTPWSQPDDTTLNVIDNGNARAREHGCQHCGKTFGRAADLRRHESKHLEPDKRHRCDQCEKHYSRADDLLKHKRKSHN